MSDTTLHKIATTLGLSISTVSRALKGHPDISVQTRKKVLSAQWEHTLLVTETGVEILTLRPEETIERFINHD